MRRTLLTLLAFIALSPLPAAAANVTVKAGETLSDIAARYGVSVGSLMRENGLRDSNHVEAGQTLRLPSGAAAGVTAGKGRHTVRSGDADRADNHNKHQHGAHQAGCCRRTPQTAPASRGGACRRG